MHLEIQRENVDFLTAELQQVYNAGFLLKSIQHILKV